MPADLETLASYVPQIIARRFAAHPAPMTEPAVERFPAAVLFADITGFTAMTERLAQRGPAGAEEVSALLNAYFGLLIELVTDHGGDVVKFAGDALLALWPAANEALSVVAHRAAQCGLVVQKTLHNYEVAEGVRLSLRVGIGAGEVFTVHIGGVNDRWEFLVAGAPLVQLKTVKQQAQPGDAILSPEAWALVQDHCVGHPLPSGDVLLGAVRTPPPALGRVAPLALPPEAEAALRAYIPSATLARLAAGQTGWLAELRRVTIIFLNLPDLNYTASLERAQRVMRAMQTTLYRYEGGINKLSVDDQGVTLVAALGLPPLSHADDAVRGVQAALAMQAAARKLGLRSAIGVATGQVFCGTVGNATRREYTMVGDIVNLATRLMQAAPDDVLCDAGTYQAAQARLTFEPLAAITVKGKAEPVAIYRPRPEAPSSDSGLTTLQSKILNPKSNTEMVGRTAERALLVERMQTVLNGGAGGVVVIEGDPGIGKSRLVEDLLRQTLVLGVAGLIGAGDAIEKSTPYHAWRPVFSQLFNLEFVTDPAARRAQVLTRLQSDPNLLRVAPLLNAVLSLDLPDNDLTGQMIGQVRADNTRRLLLSLLAKMPGRQPASAGRSPKLLILEDAHWLDSASWALALLVSREIQSMLLVIATRPMDDPLPVEYSQLLRAPGTQQLGLGPLPLDDALTLVCRRLGVAALPDPVRTLILEKAEGHPFFSEELAYALRDAGLILIDNGTCRVAPGAGDLSALNVPNTVQGVITGRIDRLAPPQQLTLKVASVIGRVFAFRTLSDIHPVEVDRPKLADYLNTLEKLDITPLDAPEPDLTYIFKHIITREVAYNLMLFAQRRQLHRAVAEWYERSYAADLSPFYPLLAHHWSSAEEASKTLDYLEKAGEQALHNYANQEALHFFSDALNLVNGASLRLEAASPTVVSTFRKARWERQLGESHFGLGNLVESREHFQRALAILGWPAPATRARLIATLLTQTLRQIVHRAWPAVFVRRARDDRAQLLEAARAYERYGEIAYFANEKTTAVAAALRTLNLAERAGLSPELARAYANLCVTAGLVRMHRLAEAYGRLARETAQSVNHLHTLARVLTRTSVYSLGVGQWAEVEDRVGRAVEIFDRLGDQRQEAEGLGLLAAAAFFQGNFARGAELRADLYAEARHSGNVQHQAWGLRGQAENILRLGQIDEAIGLLETVVGWLAGSRDRHGQIQANGLLAVACLRSGDLRRARQAANTAAALIAQSSPTVYSALEGYAGVAEVYLALWEDMNSPSAISRQLPVTSYQLSVIRDSALQACSALSKFARVFPIGRPRAWLWQGLSDWLAGRPTQAHTAWRKSLAAAEPLGMLYEQGLTHVEIGRHLDARDPARRHHLTRAVELFAQIGAAFDFARAQDALELS